MALKTCRLGFLSLRLSSSNSLTETETSTGYRELWRLGATSDESQPTDEFSGGGVLDSAKKAISLPQIASVSSCARKLRTRRSSAGGNIILRREIRSSETPKSKKARCFEVLLAEKWNFPSKGLARRRSCCMQHCGGFPPTAARLGREVGKRAFRVGFDSSRDGSVAGSERLITFNANRPPLRVVLCDEAPHASVPVGLRCWSACGMRHAGSCLLYLLHHIPFFFSVPGCQLMSPW